jgi:2-polyprenyl-6-methoxyphenol hydroxylase-like FAD-dependent oxidoreductase
VSARLPVAHGLWCVQVVQETDESAIYERGMLDRLPLDSWSTASSRVVLLGDAAHAMYAGPGQGARTAFEDAHQLLTALNAAWPDVAEVARRYEVCACAVQSANGEASQA